MQVTYAPILITEINTKYPQLELHAGKKHGVVVWYLSSISVADHTYQVKYIL